MSKLLDKIKKVDDKNLIPVEVPEWGNLIVHVKQLTVGERDSYESEVYNASKSNKMLDNPRSKFLIKVLCDEDGDPLATDFKELAALSSKPMEKLFEIAQKHNRLSDDDIEELSGN